MKAATLAKRPEGGRGKVLRPVGRGGMEEEDKEEEAAAEEEEGENGEALAGPLRDEGGKGKVEAEVAVAVVVSAAIVIAAAAASAICSVSDGNC